MGILRRQSGWIALAGCLPVVQCAAVPDVKPMNVLFIVIDDLRPELGCYGAKDMITPNIDRLAARGLKFNHAYCQYPVCNPSRSSFLTGMRPYKLDVFSNKVALREKWPDIVTLPQLFRGHGYFTAGLGKVIHKGINAAGSPEEYVDPASWDFFFNQAGTSLGKQGEGRNLTGGKLSWCRWLSAKGGDNDQEDGLIAEQAVRVLEEHRDGPFFMGVGFHKPHDPFVAPKKYFDLYPEKAIELVQEPKDRSPMVNWAIPSHKDFAGFTDKERREFKRAYHACTTFTDAQVGKVLDTLDRLDLWDSTIVILIGDNGYHLGEHEWWNKVTVYELGARVPMMVWVPGAKGMSNTTDAVVELVDIFPTLIDYCGLEAPHPLAGKSFRPVLDDPSMTWDKPAYTQVVRENDGMGYSVRTDRWRYTEWTDGTSELYDQSKDELEYYNLAKDPEYSATKKELETLLHAGFPSREKRHAEKEDHDE